MEKRTSTLVVELEHGGTHYIRNWLRYSVLVEVKETSHKNYSQTEENISSLELDG